MAADGMIVIVFRMSRAGLPLMKTLDGGTDWSGRASLAVGRLRRGETASVTK
jgi:hypothetical protein